jgi:hypothetical protein
MRGRIAAACAAVLVGVAPAGALPFASFAAAAVAVSADSATHAPPSPRREAQPGVQRAAPSQRSASKAAEARVPSIFRSPSGPAPSQAPPAAA